MDYGNELRHDGVLVVCGAPVRGGGSCRLDPFHAGHHATIVFTCDGVRQDETRQAARDGAGRRVPGRLAVLLPMREGAEVMTTLRAKITAWQQVTIRNKETGEMVTLIPTDASRKRIYGLPINPSDGRVVFPRSTWKVVE